MADISIQFHTLPEKNSGICKTIVIKYNIYIVAIRYQPFDIIEVSANNIDEFLINLPRHRRFQFTVDKPILAVANELEFGDNNTDSLRLDIGEKSELALRESWLSARTENSKALAIWRQVARRLKEITEAGAMAVQPDTGAIGEARAHRYSAGAKDLEEKGVQALTITGIIMIFGKPSK